MVSNSNGTYSSGGITTSGVNLPNLSFPTSNVRGAFIRYSVYRNTTSTGATTVSESGNLIVTYNPSGPTGNKWEISRDHVGDAQVTFGITDVGQVIFASSTLSGSSHTGVISYAAQSLLQS